MSRTGFDSRWLAGAPEDGVVKAVVGLVLGGAITVAAMIALGAIGLAGLGELVDPRSPLHQLAGVSFAWSPDGVLRASGVLRAEAATLPPVCHVLHERLVQARNPYWSEDATWMRVRRSTITFTRPGAAPIELTLPSEANVRFDPFDPQMLLGEEAARGRVALGSAPYDGRLRAECVRSGERVFVDGCVDRATATLVPCGAGSIVLTRGDGTSHPRVIAHADAILGRLAAGVASLLFLLLLLWNALRSTAVVERLAEREATASPIPRWCQVVGPSVAPLLVMLVAPSTGAGFVWACVMCAAVGLLAVAVARRRRVLERAWTHLRAARPIALRDAATRGGVMELTVRGTAAAAGVLDAYAHVWVSVRVDEVRGAKGGPPQRRVRACWPTRLEVSDGADRGALDLTDAALDLRATRDVLRHLDAAPVLRRLAASPVGALAPSADDSRWDIEQSVLAPGERICVLTGDASPTADTGTGAPYRGGPTTAMGAGAARVPKLVHAGTLGSLRSSVTVERTWLRGAWAVLIVLGAALALVTAAVGLRAAS